MIGREQDTHASCKFAPTQPAKDAFNFTACDAIAAEVWCKVGAARQLVLWPWPVWAGQDPLAHFKPGTH